MEPCNGPSIPSRAVWTLRSYVSPEFGSVDWFGGAPGSVFPGPADGESSAFTARTAPARAAAFVDLAAFNTGFRTRVKRGGGRGYGRVEKRCARTRSIAQACLSWLKGLEAYRLERTLETLE